MLLTPDEITDRCLGLYRALVPEVWGFAWLEETLAVLLQSELEAHPRTVFVVDGPLAGALLRAAARSLRDAGWQQETRHGLTSPGLRDWWVGWTTLDPALREMAITMPVEWLLALWIEATARPTPAARRRPGRQVTAVEERR